MAPRSTLSRHQKLRILRQFNARGAIHVRDLADRYKISKRTLQCIIDDKGQTKKDSEHLRGFSGDDETQDTTETSITENVNTAVGDNTIVADVKNVMFCSQKTSMESNQSDVTPAMKPVSEADYSSSAVPKQCPSRQELMCALHTLGQVVECRSHIPRWFTYVFEGMFPDVRRDHGCDFPPHRRGIASFPQRRDVLAALSTVCQAFQCGREPPAWFCFSLGRVLQDYRNRQHWFLLRRTYSAPTLLLPKL